MKSNALDSIMRKRTLIQDLNLNYLKSHRISYMDRLNQSEIIPQSTAQNFQFESQIGQKVYG